VITPAGTPPTPPAQGGVRDASWYREAAPEDTRTHQDEIMAAHGGQPSIETQNRTHGAGLPAADHGARP
jgi:hypothetical protein